MQGRVDGGMKIAALLCCVAAPVVADPVVVHATAQALFDRLPDMQETTRFGDVCGMGDNSNPDIGYCTTRNIIFVRPGFGDDPKAGYQMAHVLGHAIQVRHGVADVALREISARRDEEDALRAMVTGQVECVAGVLMARAGVAQFDLATLAREPFTDSHWGRDPLDRGPRVSIGTSVRAQWYGTGYSAGDFAACSVGEMSADLIVQALR